VNRFLFLSSLMEAPEDDFTSGSVAIHMFIMLLLKSKLHNRNKEKVQVVDIGAGVGLLAAYFAVLADEGAQVYGLDFPDVNRTARRFLNDKNAFAEGVKILTPEIVNVQDDVDLPESLTKGLADAINIGFAVPMSAPQLKEANDILKPGGLITVPILDETFVREEGVPQSCAYFSVLEKKDGELITKFRGPQVRFVPDSNT